VHATETESETKGERQEEGRRGERGNETVDFGGKGERNRGQKKGGGIGEKTHVCLLGCECGFRGNFYFGFIFFGVFRRVYVCECGFRGENGERQTRVGGVGMSTI